MHCASGSGQGCAHAQTQRDSTRQIKSALAGPALLSHLVSYPVEPSPLNHQTGSVTLPCRLPHHEPCGMQPPSVSSRSSACVQATLCAGKLAHSTAPLCSAYMQTYGMRFCHTRCSTGTRPSPAADVPAVLQPSLPLLRFAIDHRKSLIWQPARTLHHRQVA